MEQPGRQTPKTPLLSQSTTWVTVSVLAFLDTGTVLLYFFRTPGQFVFGNWLAVAGVSAGFTVAGVTFLLVARRNARYAVDEAQARQRVRTAEDKLSDEIRSSNSIVTVRGHLRGGRWVESYERFVKAPGPASVDEYERPDPTPYDDGADEEGVPALAGLDWPHQMFGLHAPGLHTGSHPGCRAGRVAAICVTLPRISANGVVVTLPAFIQSLPIVFR